MKEHSELTPIVEKYREYCAAVKAEKEALEMLEAGGLDKEMKELAELESKAADGNRRAAAKLEKLNEAKRLYRTNKAEKRKSF